MYSSLSFINNGPIVKKMLLDSDFESASTAQSATETGSYYYDYSTHRPRPNICRDAWVSWEEQRLYETMVSSHASFTSVGLQSTPKTELTVSERFIRLDKALRLPRNAFAEILGISRTTLYEAFKGVDRDYRNLERLIAVEQAARVIADITPNTIGRSGLIVRYQDESLVDILKKDSIPTDSLIAVTQLIHDRIEKHRVASPGLDARTEQYNLTDTIG